MGDRAALIVGIILVLLIGGAVTAEYTNTIPCSWYGHSSFKDVPSRCLSVFHK